MKTKSKSGKSSRRNPAHAATRSGAWNLAVAGLALGAPLFLCREAGAVGFRLPNQDPEAIARGNAFAATADNPSAIYYNPAGITQLDGQNLSAGLYLLSAGVKYEGTAGAARANGQFQPVPQLYYTRSLSDLPLSFGVGVYAPYGLSMDYGNTGPFHNVAQNGSLLYATVNPVVAWKITPELSLGAGLTINYSKVDYNQGIAGLEAFGFQNTQFHFVGDDYDFGFNAGALYKPCKYVSLGLNYHSETTMNFKGHSSTITSSPLVPNSSSPTTASITFPQYVVGGISYRPTEKWNIEFDLDWTDWHAVKQATFNGTALGAPIPNLPFHYESTFMYELGVTRYLEEGYFLSAGYFYSENSSPDANFDPLIPDSDLHLFSVGFGHKGDRWGWAFSYTLAYQPGRNVSGSSFNNPALPGSTVNGTYRILNNALNASINLKF
jgi:long-chain fatty acid transport protein